MPHLLRLLASAPPRRCASYNWFFISLMSFLQRSISINLSPSTEKEQINYFCGVGVGMGVCVCVWWMGVCVSFTEKEQEHGVYLRWRGCVVWYACGVGV